MLSVAFPTMCTGLSTVELAVGSQIVTVRLVVLIVQFGSSEKFIVAVAPAVVVTVWLPLAYPASAAVTVTAVPAGTLLNVNAPLLLVVVLPPL